MKKQFSIFLLGLLIGALASPIIGMLIPKTRSMILFMAPDQIIFDQAEKLGKSFDSAGEKREIAFLEEMKTKQNEEIRDLKMQLEKFSCQKKKDDCTKIFDEIDNSEIKLERPGNWSGSRAEMIQKLEGMVAEFKNSQNQTTDPSRKADYQVSINNANRDIVIIRDIVAKGEAKKKEMRLGECKDYKKPCEEDSGEQQ